MSDLTRRGFVKTSAGAAVGMTAIGALDVGEADAKKHAAHSHPIVAWIGDPRNGKITVMKGKHEVTIRDHKLAARIARAAK
ncbi:MAG: twin-arginine translocation signal domain-containing protein [Solirubrobacteraceae bacterium]